VAAIVVNAVSAWPGGVAGAVGLRDHDRERVSDDVVQLAGDPRPLGRGGQRRLLLERAQPRVAAVAERGRERQVGGEHEPGHERAVAGEVPAAQRERHRAGERDREAGDGQRARRVGDQRVQRDQRRAGRRQELVDDQQLAGAAEHDRREDRERRAPAQHQRRGEQDRQDERAGGRLVALAGERAQREREDERGQRAVARQRMLVDPAVHPAEHRLQA
jgi:hypothetical protein